MKPAELEKRRRLRAEIAELVKPSTLSAAERDEIAERVRRAKRAQSLFPRGNGSNRSEKP